MIEVIIAYCKITYSGIGVNSICSEINKSITIDYDTTIGSSCVCSSAVYIDVLIWKTGIGGIVICK